MERFYDKSVVAIGPQKRVIKRKQNNNQKPKTKSSNIQTLYLRKGQNEQDLSYDFASNNQGKQQQNTRQVVVLSDDDCTQEKCNQNQLQNDQKTKKIKKKRVISNNNILFINKLPSQVINFGSQGIQIQPIMEISNQKQIVENSRKILKSKKNSKVKRKTLSVQPDERLNFVFHDQSNQSHDSKFGWLYPKINPINEEQNEQSGQNNEIIQKPKQKSLSVLKQKSFRAKKAKQPPVFKRMMICDLLKYMPQKIQKGQTKFSSAVQVDGKGNPILDWEIFIKVTSIWQNRGAKKFMIIDQQGNQAKCCFQKDAKSSYSPNFIAKDQYYTISKGFICFDPNLKSIKSISLNSKAIILNINLSIDSRFKLNPNKILRLHQLPQKIYMIKQRKIPNEVNIIGIVRDMILLQSVRKGRIKMYKVIICDPQTKLEIQVNLLFQLNTFFVGQIMHLHLFKVVENPGGIMSLTTDRTSFYTIQTDRYDHLIKTFLQHLQTKYHYKQWPDYQYNMIKRQNFPERRIIDILELKNQLFENESKKFMIQPRQDQDYLFYNEMLDDIRNFDLKQQHIKEIQDKKQKQKQEKKTEMMNRYRYQTKNVINSQKEILSTVECQNIQKINVHYYRQISQEQIKKERQKNPPILISQDRPSRYISQIKQIPPNILSHFKFTIDINDGMLEMNDIQISKEQIHRMLNLCQEQFEKQFIFDDNLNQLQKMNRVEQIKYKINNRLKQIQISNKIIVQLRTSVQRNIVESVQIKKKIIINCN